MSFPPKPRSTVFEGRIAEAAKDAAKEAVAAVLEIYRDKKRKYSNPPIEHLEQMAEDTVATALQVGIALIHSREHCQRYQCDMEVATGYVECVDCLHQWNDDDEGGDGPERLADEFGRIHRCRSCLRQAQRQRLAEIVTKE